MTIPFPKLAGALAFLALCGAGAAHAQTSTASYAVMSLVGKQVHVRAVRPDVGIRTPGTLNHVLDIAETVFDTAALKAAQESIAASRPGARVVLMISDDAGLYKAQNAMFDAPAAHQADRAYLAGLLETQKVSHLLLVTTHRHNAYFKLKNGSTGAGVIEGLGFYIDDTTRLRNAATLTSSNGMLGPYAYVKVRLLDARTLNVVGERVATSSSIISWPNAEADAMAIWNTLSAEAKTGYLQCLLDGAVKEASVALLRTEGARGPELAACSAERERE